MKLYQNSRDRFWSPTQDTAKAHKREVGGDFRLVDIPSVGREALCDFLNHLQADAALDVEIAQGVADEQREASAAAEPINLASVAAERAAANRASFTASAIEDFILNRATVQQVENIFACLGTRFAEERKVA